MEVDKVGVHATHCCSKHGCKYGDSECPVERDEITQEYPCETCTWTAEQVVEWLQEATRDQLLDELVRRSQAGIL